MNSTALFAAFLRRHRHALFHVLLWSIVDALPALFSGALVAMALDRGFLHRDYIVGLAWLAVLGVAAGVRAIAATRVFPWLGAVVEPLRDELVESVVTATLEHAIAGDRSDLASVARLTSQVETVRNLVSAMLRTMRPTAVTICASLTGLLVLAPAAAALCLPPVVAALALYGALLPPLSRRQYARVLADERIAGEAGAALMALRDVVACGAEARMTEAVGSSIDAQAAATRALARASAARRLIVAVGGELPLVLVLAAAPWLTRHAGMTVGDVAGAVTYLALNLLPAMRSMVGTVGSWGLQLAVVFRRLAEATRSPAVAPGSTEPVATPRGYTLELRGASFAYGPHSDPIIHELDLVIPEDDHVAIVGPSGIGKSTLADLLSGSIQPTSGAVLLGGMPLARIAQIDPHRAVALLPERAYVFAGSLRENLTYLSQSSSDEDLDVAVDSLGLRSLIDRLRGYDSEITTLSEGERQLIALARAWLSPATIVLFDEATSHLDLATEAVVEEAFSRRGGTLVVIAHRLSSARRARRVLLMEGGR
ncbi:MAG: ABC transporter ATP-binding protein, partial [Solirubrobacterales bacterium]|nr:ABC transporter ATP-binding protein [Solirubrobacterales bacterium]